MKNYIQPGETITVTAPYALTSGAGCLVGSLFGFATNDAASGAAAEIVTEGVFDGAKNSAEAWTVGALVYWDNTNKVLTTTATGNKLVGVAVAAAVNPSSVGRVRLNSAYIG